MFALLFTTVLGFASLALFAPDLVQVLAVRYRLRHPNRVLLLVFRAWFTLLTLATVLLVLFQLRRR